MTQEDKDQEGLDNVVHRRRGKKGSRPGFTCKAISGGPEGKVKEECWLPSGRGQGSGRGAGWWAALPIFLSN